MKNNYLIGLILFLIACIFLVPLCAITPQYFDGAEYAVSAYHDSRVHQPGYPWFMFITKNLVSIFNTNPYFTISCFSMLCHILGSIVVFFTSTYLTNSRILSISVSLAVLFFSESLKIATDAEVFGMHFLLTSCILLLSIKHHYEAFSRLRLGILAFTCGVASAHHQSIILWAPFVLTLVIAKDKENLKRSLFILFIFGSLGFLGNIFLYFNQNIISYKTITSISELFNCILRSNYGTFSLHKSDSNINYSYFFDFLIICLKQLPFFIFLTAILVIKTFREKQTIFIAAFISLLFHLWFFEQFKFPIKELESQQISFRFTGVLALNFIFLSLIVLKHSNLEKYYKLFSGLIIIPILFYASDNYAAANSGKDLTVLSELNSIEKEVPPKEVFFTTSDRILMGVHYQQIINHRLKDRIFIHMPALGNKDYEEIILKRYPELRKLPILNYQTITNYYYEHGKRIYSYLEGPAPEGFYKLPIGLTWIFIKNDSNLIGYDIVKNIINNCYRLPKSIFNIDKERIYSKYIVTRFYSAPFQVFVDNYKDHPARSMVNELIKTIESGQYAQTKELCDKLRLASISAEIK